MSNDNKIKRYSVRIEYNYGNGTGKKCGSGSGVIVKPNDNSDYYYILTARHTFKKNKEDNNIDPNINDIVIEYFYDEEGNRRKEENRLKCSNLIEIAPEHDIVVLILNKNENQCLKKIPSISILGDDEGLTKCTVVGYPATREVHKGESELYVCDYHQDQNVEKEKKFEIRSSTSLSCYRSDEKNSIQGLSGGGVFVQNKEDYYLVGIQIEIRNPNKFVCVDLRAIAEEINKRLGERPEIIIVSVPCSELEGVDLNELRFDKVKEQINNEKIKCLKKIDEKQFNEIKNNNSEHTKSLKKDVQEIEKKLSEIADVYLYRGIICHENRDNRRATSNFNKAIKYRSHYKIYFLHAEGLRKENKENLITGDSSSHEKQQTISLLEQNLHEKNKPDDELERDYLTLLRLYENQEKEDNSDPLLSKKKGDILDKLGGLYEKKEDYEKSERAFLKSIELSKDLHKKLIPRYGKLINVLNKQEKYQEAKKYCLEVLEFLKEPVKGRVQLRIQITMYKYLIILGYRLKEENATLDKYYQDAKKLLSEEELNNPQLYQELSKVINKTWLDIRLRLIKQYVHGETEELVKRMCYAL